MASAYAVSGSLSLAISLSALGSGDVAGALGITESDLLSIASTEGAGWVNGVFVAAAGDLSLAHASDPLGSMGDAAYFPPGFVVAGKRIRAIRIRNNDLTNTVTVISKASTGAPIFLALGDGVTLQKNGGEICLVFPDGTATITAGVNDLITVSVGGGTPNCEITVIYAT